MTRWNSGGVGQEAIGFDGVEPAFLGMSLRRVRCAPWWQEAGIDPVKAARKLWNDSRMDQGRIGPGPTAQRPAADRTADFDSEAANIRPPASHGRYAPLERPSSINIAQALILQHHRHRETQRLLPIQAIGVLKESAKLINP